MNLEFEFALLNKQYANYPHFLQIRHVAEILREDLPTIRARIRRGAFPIVVRQEPSGRQYVLLADLIRFLCSGESQVKQVETPHKAGKRGRPRKTVQLKSKGDV